MAQAGETPSGPTLITRLRLVAGLTLVVLAFRLPAELRYASPARAAVLPRVYAVPALVALAALAASFTTLGRRRMRWLVVAYTVGLMGSTLLALYSAHTHPLVVADALFALMMFTLVFFEWTTRGMALLAALACGGLALGGYLRPPPDVAELSAGYAMWSLAVSASAAVGCAYLLDRLRARLAARERDLVTLSGRLMSVQEEERRRLSRDLHDGVGQSLTAILSYLWLIEHELPPEAAALRSRTAEARRLASTTMSEVRELSQLLRPAVLDDYGLVPTLESYLRAFAEREKLDASLDADELPGRLPADVEIAIYRITQEALTNVARHAHASRVRVALHRGPARLALVIEDDGIGIERANGDRPLTGSGLIGIRERARALGGRMRIRSERGTRLIVELPLDPSPGLPQPPATA